MKVGTPAHLALANIVPFPTQVIDWSEILANETSNECHHRVFVYSRSKVRAVKMSNWGAPISWQVLVGFLSDLVPTFHTVDSLVQRLLEKGQCQL